MSTAPKMKPVKGAGKQETDALTASVTARPETGHRLALAADWASVLDSVGKLFERDACRSIDGMFDVHHQLHACIEHGAAEGGDANLAFELAHQIVREGLDKWMRKLREIAGATVTDLARIAQAHPEWATEDPASWARGRTKELLDGYLNGGRIPRIAIWFRQACDGPDLDFDRFEHGRPEPWCAPTWVARSKYWTNDPASLGERLTPELTQKFLQTRRREYDLSLEIWLKESEHTARVSLAMQPALPVQFKDSVQTNQGAREGGALPKPARSRESILQALLNRRGWSTHDLAVNAGVDFNTAKGYLKGLTKPYRSTRKKLADALGVGIEELPN